MSIRPYRVLANLRRFTLPSSLVKAYDKTVLLDDILSERTPTLTMNNGKPAPYSVVKTMATKANSALQALLREYTNGDSQKALALIQELSAQDSILKMVNDKDDYALAFRRISNPKEYQAVMDYLDEDK